MAFSRRGFVHAVGIGSATALTGAVADLVDGQRVEVVK